LVLQLLQASGFVHFITLLNVKDLAFASKPTGHEARKASTVDVSDSDEEDDDGEIDEDGENLPLASAPSRLAPKIQVA